MFLCVVQCLPFNRIRRTGRGSSMLSTRMLSSRPGASDSCLPGGVFQCHFCKPAFATSHRRNDKRDIAVSGFGGIMAFFLVAAISEPQTPLCTAMSPCPVLTAVDVFSRPPPPRGWHREQLSTKSDIEQHAACNAVFCWLVSR